MCPLINYIWRCFIKPSAIVTLICLFVHRNVSCTTFGSVNCPHAHSNVCMAAMCHKTARHTSMSCSYCLINPTCRHNDTTYEEQDFHKCSILSWEIRNKQLQSSPDRFAMSACQHALTGNCWADFYEVRYWILIQTGIAMLDSLIAIWRYGFGNFITTWLYDIGKLH